MRRARHFALRTLNGARWLTRLTTLAAESMNLEDAVRYPLEEKKGTPMRKRNGDLAFAGTVPPRIRTAGELVINGDVRIGVDLGRSRVFQLRHERSAIAIRPQLASYEVRGTGY